MTFRSILFKKTEDGIKEETLEAPAFFVDLNLNQIIDAITAGKNEYNLKPFFYTPLKDIDTIQYRQEVMKDLENKTLFEYIKSFAKKMNKMRIYLALVDNLYYKFHKEGWFLEAVAIYCEAVNCLAHDLGLVELKSRGLLAFREYFTNYAKSDVFTSLLEETKKLKADLSTVKYCLLIKGNRVKVRKYESEIDYSVEVEETFDKFKQGAVEDYRAKLPTGSGMNHVEAQILDLVAKLYPDIFLRLDEFSAKNSNFGDETINVFDREIQFYVAYLEFLAKFKRAGLKFCYPEISNTSKEVYDYEGFDLALANKLIAENSSVVCNDFYLKGKERIFVVSGPNQGGKTTFARTFGQLHYLASLGCPVPGREARLFISDMIFTHFEKEENIKNLRGKLQDDLVRIHDILNQATSNSIVIVNEIFTSTTLKDAIFLGRKVMEKIIQLDALCVCVTFIDELASLSEQTVSMVSTIVPENPALRTYKIIRRPADGLAYAISIAEKYRLTYDCLKERIKI
ncbi:MAG: MutS domain protein, family 5 [Firmicutes bacterium]|nr:MutS domain protein, family 5 [Bacillota bacterium]MDI6704976.1 DNA mismatch repair protein MutS [Bacillota bacterium]